jgi:hypothetical protein
MKIVVQKAAWNFLLGFCFGTGTVSSVLIAVKIWG